MRADAWSRLIDRLIADTITGRLAWRTASDSGAAVASTTRGSFVVRYIGGIGMPTRPSLEVRDAEGQVLDRLEAGNPMARFATAVTGDRPVLPAPTLDEVEHLVRSLERLVEAIGASSDRIEAVAFDILGEP